MRRRFGALISLLLTTAIAATGLTAATTTSATAADGTIVRTITGQVPDCSVGTGIGFTGQYLLLTCWYDPNIYVLDPADGSLITTLPVEANSEVSLQGLGAIAFDRQSNSVWACTYPEERAIKLHPSFLWDSETGHVSVTDSGFVPSGGCIDGLAYDGTDETLFASGDVRTEVMHYTTDGTLLSTRSVAGKLGACGNSGLAVGGDELFLANNGCSEIYRAPKNFSADPTLFASYPERLEDLECDDITFAGTGQTVIWSKDAYDPVLNAFQIGPRDCGYGGLPSGVLEIFGAEQNNLVGATATFTIVAPAAADGAEFSAPLAIESSSGPNKDTGFNLYCNLSCSVSPKEQVTAHVEGVEWPAPEGVGEGTDRARVYVDLNENGVYDDREPFAFVKWTWLRHTDFVGLGDSYSSGEGLDPYESGTDVDFPPGVNQCHRSTQNAFAHYVNGNDDGFVGSLKELSESSEAYGTSWAFNACAGSTTDDILDRSRFTEPGAQIDQAPLGYDTDLVTLSIGGNDLGFAPLLTHCGITPDCGATKLKGKVITDILDDRLAALGPRITDTMTAIKDATKNEATGNEATVVLVGYPHLFPDTEAEQTCATLSGVEVPFTDIDVGFEVSEQTLMNEAADRLVEVMRNAANDAGVLFVDPTYEFLGHAPCDNDGDKFTESLTVGDLNDIKSKGAKNGAVGTGAFHPTVLGQQHYGELVNDKLRTSVYLFGTDPTGLPLNPPAQANRTASFAQSSSTSGSTALAEPSNALPLLGELYSTGTGTCALPGVTQAGGGVRVSGDGFAPNTPVTITRIGAHDPEDAGVVAGTATSDANGYLDATVPVPADAAGTVLRLQATGMDANGNDGLLLGNVVVYDTCADQPATWPFDGFYDPVAVGGVANVVNAGRGIPMKFSLGADRGLDIFAAGNPRSVSIDCQSGAETNQVTETLTAGQSQLTYDTATGTYTYVWKTEKAWAGTCRKFSMTLKDGSTHTALFNLR